MTRPASMVFAGLALAMACSVNELPDDGRDGAGAVSGTGAAAGSSGALGGVDGGNGGASGSGNAAGDSGNGGSSGSGGSNCPSTLGDCDSNLDNGCEEDLTSSKQHCGACDHDCLGGECAGSKCQPFALYDDTIDATFTGPWGLAIDATHLYVAVTRYSMTGYVFKIGKDGTAPVKIAPSEGEPYDIVADSSHVYWTNRLDVGGSVRRVSNQGGTVQTLASSQERPVGISLGADDVYWSNDLGKQVRKVPKAGGAVVDLATGMRPRSTAVDGAFLYFVDVTAKSVNRVSVTGGTVTPVVTGLTAPWVVAVDPTGTQLFFAEFSPNRGVYHAAKNASNASPEPLVTGEDHAMSVHLDGAYVYYTSHTDPGFIARVPKSGGTAEVLANNLVSPTFVKTDATAIYWIDYSSHRLMKLAK